MPNEDITRDEQSGMILLNTMEESVRDAVDEIIPTMDMCGCGICRLNACAIALNHLTPHYVTTTTGKLLVKVPAERTHAQTDVIVEVTKALLIVKEHPLHQKSSPYGFAPSGELFVRIYAASSPTGFVALAGCQSAAVEASTC